MQTGRELLDHYGAYHRDPRNLVCHEIGIPLIVLGIIALLRLVPLPVVWSQPHDLAAAAVLATAIYYLFLVVSALTEKPHDEAAGRRVMFAALVAIVALFVLYAVGAYLAWPFAIAAFVIGWIFQFVGHAYEGKSPAFLTNLLHLLVGPLWVASHLVPKSASSSSAR